jgi:hypothetical protein
VPVLCNFAIKASESPPLKPGLYDPGVVGSPLPALPTRVILLSGSKITSETDLSSPGPPISVEKISVDRVGSNLLTAISISPLNEYKC